MAAAASTSRVASGSSARRRSAFRRASSAGAVLDVEHAGHQRQRLEQLGRLLVGGAQPRRRAVDDRHRVLDALGAPERVREDERRAERHAVVVARDVERLAQVVLARRLPGRGLGDPELEQQPGALGRRAAARPARDAGARPRTRARRAAPRCARRRPGAARSTASPAGSVASRCSAACSSPAGLVVHQLSRAAVGQRALGDPELLVDAGAHERVDEGQRPLGLEDPGRHQRVRRLGGLRRGRARPARPRAAAAARSSTATARARRAAGARQATQAQLDPAARGAGADRLDARGRARVGRSCPRALTASTSSRTRNGTPPVARWHAAVKAGSGAAPSRASTSRPHRGDAQRRRAAPTSACGSAVSVASRWRLLDARPRAARRRAARSAAPAGAACRKARKRSEDASAQWASSTLSTTQLVGGQVRAQPVEAVQDREGRVGRRRGRLALLQRARAARARGRPAAPAPAAGRRARRRSPRASIGSKSWRTTPKAKSRSSSAPRARRKRVAPSSRGDPGGREDGRLADPRRSLDDHAAPRSRARRGDRRVDAAQLALALEEQVDSGRRRGAHGVERTAGTERRRSRTFQP